MATASSSLPQVGGSTPVPDPTLLTTAQLNREIEALREVLTAESAGRSAILAARLDGMDTAIKLRREVVDAYPNLIDREVRNLRELHEEKFNGIDKQFKERDTRTEQSAAAVKIAVDAALQAQKESVGEQNKSSALAIAKSDASTTKQIDQQGILITNMNNALDEKIQDLKAQLAIVVTQQATTAGKGTGYAASWQIIGSAIAAVAAVLSVEAFFNSRAVPVVAAPVPQIVYLPSPAPTPLIAVPTAPK